MFTGIIQAVGAVEAVQPQGGDARIRINAGKLPMLEVQLGDSICVSGVCLTVIDFDTKGFSADVSNETLSRTTLGALRTQDAVNLELALTPSTRMGGHFVSGHVDGVGTVAKRWTDGRSERFRIDAPDSLAKYIAEKGSICVDGISLTVNAVERSAFELNIVPHTLKETTMGHFQPGRKVNLEVDIIARYLERLLLGTTGEEAARSVGSPISAAFLKEHGFL
jgi:riboflavin synthase